MDINSTSKMLAKMHSLKKVDSDNHNVDVDDPTEIFSTPQLKPGFSSPDMKHVLTNSLAQNLTDDNTPMG